MGEPMLAVGDALGEAEIGDGEAIGAIVGGDPVGATGPGEQNGPLGTGDAEAVGAVVGPVRLGVGVAVPGPDVLDASTFASRPAAA